MNLNTQNNKEKIKKHIEYLRDKYNIEKYPNEVEKMCNECDVENLLFADKNNFGYEQIKLSNYGIKEPFHRASLIGYNTDNGPIWFIVDPTYGQFFEDEEFKKYMLDNYKEFSLELLEQGYIKCTLLNMLSYINGFILSKTYKNEIDIDEVYSKVEELLYSNNIVNKDITDTKKRLIDLLSLKKEILIQVENNSNQKSK